jgi:hypothetical protein
MLDNTGSVETGKIDHGHKKDRVAVRIGEGESQIVAHGESNRLIAAGALRFDFKRKLLLSQFPLHEGSCYGVRSSGSAKSLTTGKSHLVGRRLGCYWVSPDDISASRPEQENETSLQFIQDLYDPCLIQLQTFCNEVGRHRPGDPRQLFYHEVMHAPVLIVEATQDPFGLRGSASQTPRE